MPREKILIVDDEKKLVELLTRILVKLDYTVATAHNGVEAMERAIAFNPDFVLLDIQMPETNGIELLAQLRSHHRFKLTPVVILSAKSQLHEIKAGLEAGADAYLCKPVMVDEIVNAIESFLGD